MSWILCEMPHEHVWMSGTVMAEFVSHEMEIIREPFCALE